MPQIKNLKETSNLMTSTDHKDRFIAEYWQVKIRSEKLETFSNMTNMTNNYFGDGDNSTRFNRPISPECFITLRYHRDDECWLFDYPEIKHFHGIGNTFYIDTKLTGTEIFKFFVLYIITIM